MYFVHQFKLVICSLFFFLIAVSTSYAETRCVVWDQNDTSANVRASPNGILINRLRNGRIVYAQRYDWDQRNRPWAYVSGYYKGRWRNWGWIYMDLLRCR